MGMRSVMVGVSAGGSVSLSQEMKPSRVGKRGRVFNTMRLFLPPPQTPSQSDTAPQIYPNHLAQSHDQRGGFTHLVLGHNGRRTSSFSVVPGFKTPRLGHSQATHNRLQHNRAWPFMSTQLRNVSLDRWICVPRSSNWDCSRTFHARLISKLRSSTLRKLSHAGETTPEPHHIPPLPTMPSELPRDSYLPLGLEC